MTTKNICKTRAIQNQKNKYKAALAKQANIRSANKGEYAANIERAFAAAAKQATESNAQPKLEPKMETGIKDIIMEAHDQDLLASDKGQIIGSEAAENKPEVAPTTTTGKEKTEEKIDENNDERVTEDHTYTNETTNESITCDDTNSKEAKKDTTEEKMFVTDDINRENEKQYIPEEQPIETETKPTEIICTLM
jgi:hypothetical protein